MTLGIGCCNTDLCTPDLPQSGTAVIYQGCGTQSLCDLLQFSSSYMWSSLQHNFTCAPSGNALSCTSCQSLGAAQPTCTDSSSVQCAANEQCSTAYRKTASGGAVSYDVIRGCSPSEKCNKVGSLTYSGNKMTLGLGCCTSTTCTPDLPQLPTESSSSNGVQCGTCASEASTTCNTTANITCSGNEKRCVAYTQTGTGAAIVYQGCGTQSLCDLQQFSASYMGFSLQHSFTCSPLGTSSGGISLILIGGLSPGFILTVMSHVILMNHWM
ncbi:hypothetical protein GDO81_020403 [Engystomops pustulosus]|uniref:Uncharacterized protein n=1 Tax=Engystomops pustulosus TaxID=76066 RepID=A0AAV6ZQN0_ENGPU|nr:hypothetical protein GDO81_020403 [Engystomops pustulosus]